MIGSRIGACAAAALILTVPLAAQPTQKQAIKPAGAQSAGIKPANDGDMAPRGGVFQFALANGMQVVVIPDHRAPVVTQMLWFKVGAVDDPPGISGLAHFFEHMMFRGTKSVPGDQFAQIIAKNGGELNAFTTHDYTAFYEQIASDRLKLAMDMEADRIANLDLSDNNVVTERNVVLEERRMRVENNPQSLAAEQISAALHLSHPYGRPVIGWANEVGRIDTVAARDFYKHHYAPNNATLIIAGDVTPDQARLLAQSEYGKVPARELQLRAEFTEPPRLAETRMDIVRPDVEVPVFERIYRVASYAQAAPGQAEGLEMLAQTLGGDQNAALYRVLVEEKKLATDAGASYNGYARDAAEFSVYAVPRSGVSLDAVEKAIDQVLANFAAAPQKASDMNRARTQLVASVTYRRDSQQEMATAYGVALMIGLTADDVNDWPNRIRAINAEDVRKAAGSLDRKNAVSATLRPGK